MAIPEQQLGDLSFRGVMLLGAYGAEDLMVTSHWGAYQPKEPKFKKEKK